MIPFQDALARVLEESNPLGIERVPLRGIGSRTLAEPLYANADLPRFDNSAVDGYGLGDLESPEYRLRGAIPAGTDAGPFAIGPGEAVRIFTGSPTPEGVVAIAMQEDVVVDGDRVQLEHTPKAGDHVRRCGSEVRDKTLLVPAPAAITPSIASLFATFGETELTAYRQPRVAIVGTGSELVPPGTPLRAGQIYESNMQGLEVALQGAGAKWAGSQLVGDRVEDIREALRSALEADVVLTSGGVSVGDHDLVRETLASLGVQERFWRVAMKPGKPFYFGIGPAGQRVFGLPGNPVSALVTFAILVRPALLKMVGLQPPFSPRLPIGKAITADAKRDEFVRATWSDQRLWPVQRNESHMLSGLAQADALIRLPAGSGTVEAGELVEAIPLEARLPNSLYTLGV